MEEKEKIKKVEQQLRQTYAQIVWTHKIQEKQADIFRKRHNCFNVAGIIAASLTSSGIIASFFTDSNWVRIITAVISFIALFLNLYLKSYDLSSLASEHKKSALELLSIRNRLTSTLTDIKLEELGLKEIKAIRDKYLEELDTIYRGCRDAGDKAVCKARESLTNIQDNSFSEEEIDSYLPLYTKKGGVK